MDSCILTAGDTQDFANQDLVLEGKGTISWRYSTLSASLFERRLRDEDRINLINGVPDINDYCTSYSVSHL